MKDFFRTINSRLARRIGLYVILASTLLSIFTSGFQIYSEFKRERNGVYDTLNQIEKTHLASIAARVWVLDSDELNITLKNLLELSSIRYIAVFEGSDVIATAGKNTGSNVVVRKFPLIYNANNLNNTVGHLIVKASLDEVYQNVFDRALLIIASNLFKTFFIAVFILFIFYKLVTRHLSDISDFLLNDHSFTTNKILSLSRSSRKNDELDLLVDSINEMQVRLNQQFEEINQQKQHLAQTLNSIGDAVISTDIDGKVTQMNPVAEQLTGWLTKDAAGESIKIIFPIINATTLKEIENPIDKVMKSGEVVYLSNHTTLLSKNGEKYQIADSAAPIKDENGNILGMVLVFNDVTEQYELRQQAKLNEKKYRTLATVAPVGLFYTDVNGKCLYVNEKWSEISGLSLTDAMGEGWSDAIYGEDKDKVFSEWNDLAKNRNNFKLEYRFQDNDKIKWVLGQAIAEEDAEGKIIGYVGTVTDITDRKEAEYALNRSQKMDALGKLTGGIAHDYNNMLSVILGYAELLQARLKDDLDLSGYVREIYEAGVRGAKLTGKLLSFSRQKTMVSEIANLNSILYGEQDMLEKTLTVSIKLDLDLAEDLWPVKVDCGDLDNVIINLCINARHAMDGHGDLTIKTCNVFIEDHAYVSLCISDNGCGINEDEKEKIFDPFYTTKGDLGTGLGLSQVYGFVERSGGSIHVDSEVGKGTKFTILFPRFIEEKVINEEEAQLDSINRSGNETILVVDDEVALLKLTTEILNNNGYRVFCAESGKEALEILEHESIDLLLSDVIMPRMNGYKLAEIVQEKYPKIKIQMASGFTDELGKGHRNNELHKNLLHKPYHMDMLLEKVRGLLDS